MLLLLQLLMKPKQKDNVVFTYGETGFYDQKLPSPINIIEKYRFLLDTVQYIPAVRNVCKFRNFHITLHLKDRRARAQYAHRWLVCVGGAEGGSWEL